MLSIVMLNAIMLGVVMLGVLALTDRLGTILFSSGPNVIIILAQ
jgi:hypothetical protein